MFFLLDVCTPNFELIYLTGVCIPVVFPIIYENADKEKTTAIKKIENCLVFINGSINYLESFI